MGVLSFVQTKRTLPLFTRTPGGSGRSQLEASPCPSRLHQPNGSTSRALDMSHGMLLDKTGPTFHLPSRTLKCTYLHAGCHSVFAVPPKQCHKTAEPTADPGPPSFRGLRRMQRCSGQGWTARLMNDGSVGASQPRQKPYTLRTRKDKAQLTVHTSPNTAHSYVCFGAARSYSIRVL